MLYLAQRAMGMSADGISTYSMPISRGGYYQHPDPQKIEEMIREIYSVQPAPEAPEDAAGEENAAEGSD
jgi:hypothetical protein